MRMVAGVIVGVVLVMAVAACTSAPVPPSRPVERTVEAPAAVSGWTGIWLSPEEISGFSGTRVAILRDEKGNYTARTVFHTDVVRANSPRYGIRTSTIKVGGQTATLEVGGQPEQYTLAVINDHLVLLREDAWRVFTQEDRLYDYGILIKVSDDPGGDLENLARPSIKLLYADAAKPWRDPFVGGSNGRQ